MSSAHVCVCPFYARVFLLVALHCMHVVQKSALLQLASYMETIAHSRTRIRKCPCVHSHMHAHVRIHTHTYTHTHAHTHCIGVGVAPLRSATALRSPICVHARSTLVAPQVCLACLLVSICLSDHAHRCSAVCMWGYVRVSKRGACTYGFSHMNL